MRTKTDKGGGGVSVKADVRTYTMSCRHMSKESVSASHSNPHQQQDRSDKCN